MLICEVSHEKPVPFLYKWIELHWMKFQQCCVSVCVVACSMRSLRKTVLLALVASVVLVLAVLHSWPTRVYSTVDVRYRPGPGAERLLEERLPEPDPSSNTIPYRVRESVARSVSWCVMFYYKTSVQVEGDGCRTPAAFYNYLSQTFISWDI